MYLTHNQLTTTMNKRLLSALIAVAVFFTLCAIVGAVHVTGDINNGQLYLIGTIVIATIVGLVFAVRAEDEEDESLRDWLKEQDRKAKGKSNGSTKK